MAVLIDFQKVQEDGREVEYMFGQGRPLDGDRNSAFGAVLVKIVRYYRSKATWPERGVYSA